MRCQDIKNKLELYIDNELTVREKAEIEQHLLTCSNCAKELEVLKSLNAFGKLKPLSEAEPEYWKQLSHGIMHQIAGRDAKVSWIGNAYKVLLRIIWPEKISYRLVGLAATAVLIFFIVHISFFRNGKFEVSIEIGAKDTIKVFQPKSFPPTSQKEIELTKEIPEVKSVTKITKSIQEKDVDLPKANESELKNPVPQPSIDNENKIFSTSTKRVEMASTEDLPSEKPTIAAFDPVFQSGKKEKIDKFEMMKTATQLKKLKGTGFSTTAISNRSNYSESDTSLNQYQLVIQHVQSIQNLNEKIDAWEKYLQTNPEIELTKKAISELAMLYYQLVEENPTQKNIHLAFSFYSDNLQSLSSMPDSIYFKKQFEMLQELFKKNE